MDRGTTKKVCRCEIGKVTYMDYYGYPGCPYLFPPFEHKVSIPDLILNTGNDAKRFEIFTDLHATFHIGNEKSWKTNRYDDYLLHN